MRRTRIMITATTRRMWMKPPSVYEVTNPRSQSMRRITAMVVSIFVINLMTSPKVDVINR